MDRRSEQNRAYIAALIEERLERLSDFERYALERENLALDAEARRFSVPSADATDKILRYEGHSDRQFYRALDQLERLQCVKAKMCHRLSVSVSTGGASLFVKQSQEVLWFQMLN